MLAEQQRGVCGIYARKDLLTISDLVSAIIQVGLVWVLTFLVWLVRGRKQQSYVSWIGLKLPKIENQPLFWKVYLSASLGSIALGSAMLLFLSDRSDLAVNELYGLGISGLAAAVIFAFFQTALSEELLFRGFIGKRAIAALGFPFGNLVQSVLFGLLHGVLFYGSAGMLRAAIYSVFAGALGWVMGYLNESLAGGSIIPSWSLHSLMNLFSSALMLFSVLK